MPEHRAPLRRRGLVVAGVAVALVIAVAIVTSLLVARAADETARRRTRDAAILTNFKQTAAHAEPDCFLDHLNTVLALADLEDAAAGVYNSSVSLANDDAAQWCDYMNHY